MPDLFGGECQPEQTQPCPVCGAQAVKRLRPDTPHHAELRCPNGHHRWLPKPKDTQMPKLNEMFPSKYLKAADFDEAGSVLTIDRLEQERIGQGKDADDKWVMYFEEIEKGLVLNKTNTNIVAALYGDDTDDWVGKLVTLYATETSFQGEQVECVRIKKKAPKPKKAAAAAAKPAAREVGEDSAEDVDPDDPKAIF